MKHIAPNGHADSGVRYTIQVLTQRGHGWQAKTDGDCKIMNAAIVAADSFLGRKFPQRIAVRVVDSAGRVVFQRIKQGYKSQVLVQEARDEILRRYEMQDAAA